MADIVGMPQKINHEHGAPSKRLANASCKLVPMTAGDMQQCHQACRKTTRSPLFPNLLDTSPIVVMRHEG
jgi:hypothetical protein